MVGNQVGYFDWYQRVQFVTHGGQPGVQGRPSLHSGLVPPRLVRSWTQPRCEAQGGGGGGGEHLVQVLDHRFEGGAREVEGEEKVAYHVGFFGGLERREIFHEKKLFSDELL